MKKISTLLLLLMGVLLPWAASAQQTAVLNDGTTTMTYVPFYGLYADYGAKGQFIIPATDLANKGITSGCQISKLKFFSNATSSGTYFGSSVIVEVGEVSYTTFSSATFVTSGLTTVLSGTSLSRSSDGTMVVSFSSNYTYNGGNLLISIGGYGSGCPSTSWLGISSNNAGVYGYNSSNSATIPTSTKGTTSYAPKTEITYILSNTPYISLNPATATVFTGFTQTLTATYGNVSGTPSITYTSSNTNVATVSGNGATATVTGVATGTATITATMNGSYTATCTITVEAPHYCTPNPSSIDGQGITAVNFGTGDVVSNSNSSGLPSSSPFYGDYTSMVGSFDPGATATVSITYTTGSYTYYNYGTLIWVDWNKDYTFDDSEIVFEGQSSQSSNPSGPHTLDATFTVPANQAADDYRMRIAGADSYFDRYLSGYSDGNHDACFSSSYAVCHDYTLRVAIPATCPTPTGLVVSDITSNSAKLAWTPGDSETSWEYLCIAHGDTPDWTSQNVITSFTHSNVPANILAGTGQQPQPETEYDFYVRANCGGGDYSTPAMISFTTLEACPAPTPGSVSNLMPTSATLNWTSDADDFYARYRVAAHEETTFFDDFESGDLNGWTVYTNGQSLLDLGLSYEGWFVYNLGENHEDGSYVANAWSYYQFDDETYGSFDADNWLITPQVTLGGTLKFWVWANYSDEFEVLLSTSGTATSSFTTTLRSLQAPSANSTWEEVTVDLSDYSGQGYIAIHHVFEDGWYLLVDDFGIYVNEPAGQWLPNNSGEYSATTSLDIDHLTPETEYEWQVMADCGSTDGVSAWSSIATFTTPSACAAPSAPNTTDITAVSAKLNWTGAQENYNVSYGKVFFYEDFENGLPSTWTIIDSDGDGNNWYGADNEYNYAHNGTHMVVSASYSGSALTPDNWLITPQLELKGTMSVWLRNQDPGYPETFAIYLSTNSTNVSDFTTTLVAETNALGKYTEYTADLSSYNGQQGYIAIRHFNCTDKFRLVLDDFGIYDLQSTTSTASNVTVNGLEPMTEYIWKVQGDDCDGNGSTTDWSDYVFFTTAEGYVKHIEPYTSDGGYYLIASPLANNVAPTDVTGMITDNLGANVDETTSTYDLYSFDQAQELEWRNYRANTFELVNGQGYLYASKEGTELVFTGAGNTGNTQDVTLYMTDAATATGLDFPDWNLVGNPFAKDNAYLSDGRAFYSMQNSGVYTPQLGPVAIGPMEGVFVVANSNEETLTFTTTQPNSKVAQLTLNLTKSASAGSTLLDRAIVSFDEGSQLPKLQFRNGSTKVYIPLEGKDYAVVRSEAMGTMPVNFKAENNGTYTLSFTAEEVSFAYLHLIDNMTGNDVDLLKTPSYSFEAKTTDYESRFKLVFAAGNSNDDTFAFYSNGSFVINNEGNATLQVIDVNGRILKSESINGCANINVKAAAGVYMLRLVNGNDVKVQKVVVR